MFMVYSDQMGYAMNMLFKNPLKMISTIEEVEELSKHLATQTRIAVDLEGNSLHHYKERLCLMQISDVDTDYIIDLMALDHIDPLIDIMQSPEILKVMHGSDYDVVSLKRDYNCEIVNLFDTGIAAQFLNYTSFGLSSMILHYFGIHLDKRYQKYDWSRRPLYDEHIQYARGDTHFLLALHDILIIKLQRTPFLEACYEESQCLTEKEWNGRQFEGHDYLRLKNVHKLSLDEKKVLRALFELRENLAEKKDVPVHFIAPNESIYALSQIQPANAEALKTQMPRDLVGHFKKQPNIWLEAVRIGQQDEREIPEIKAPKKPKQHKNFQGINTKLREWRAQQQDNGAAPISLLSNQQIKAVAMAAPKTLEKLGQVPDIRQWQVSMYGEQWLQLIQAGLQR